MHTGKCLASLIGICGVHAKWTADRFEAMSAFGHAISITSESPDGDFAARSFAVDKSIVVLASLAVH